MRAESDCRRDTDLFRWRPGVAIALPGGQSWHFPRPTLGFRPEFGPDGPRYAPRAVWSFGADYDALVDAYVAATDGLDEANALLALACDLLRRNYDLADDELAELLARWPDDEEGAASWTRIAEVALGRAPKPSVPGSAAP